MLKFLFEKPKKSFLPAYIYAERYEEVKSCSRSRRFLGVEATGARLGAFAVSGLSVLGGIWLIGAAFAC